MIQKLTPKQKNKLKEYKEKWVKIGLSTERFKKEDIRKDIDDLYTIILKRKKVPIFVFDNPIISWIAVCMLFKELNGKFSKRNVKQEVWGEVREEVGQEVNQEVWEKIEQEVSREVREEVGRGIEWEVKQEVGEKVERNVRQEVEWEVRQEAEQEIWEKTGQEVGREVREKVWEEVWEKIEREVREEVGREVRQEVGQEVGREVRQEVGREVREEVWGGIGREVKQEVEWEAREKVWAEVWEKIEREVRQEAEQEIWEKTGQEVRREVREKVWEEVWEKIEREVKGEVRRGIEQEIRGEVENIYFPYIYGSFDTWYSFYDFFNNEVFKLKNEKKFNIIKNMSKVGFVWACKDFCVISQKPQKILKNKNGLHSDRETSFEYAGKLGTKMYHLNGIKVPEWLITTKPEEIDVQKVLGEKNTDVQREIIRKIGAERLIQKLNPKTLDKWTQPGKNLSYKLYEVTLPNTNIKRKYLYYEHASVPGIFFCKPVPPQCKKVIHARAFQVSMINDKEIKRLTAEQEQKIMENLPTLVC